MFPFHVLGMTEPILWFSGAKPFILISDRFQRFYKFCVCVKYGVILFILSMSVCNKRLCVGTPYHS